MNQANLSLSEMRDRLFALESRIEELVRSFETETGLAVTEIRIPSEGLRNMQGEKLPATVEVEVSIEFGHRV